VREMTAYPAICHQIVFPSLLRGEKKPLAFAVKAQRQHQPKKKKKKKRKKKKIKKKKKKKKKKKQKKKKQCCFKER